MPVFHDSYTVQAPLKCVADFHKSTRALKQLTPPPVYVQIHHFEPLAEGSQSEFTLWFGPLPVRWLAVHAQVNPERGFIDTQVRGPMKSWQHSHSWQAISAAETRMEERVEYEHRPGLAGLFSRLLFAPPLLGFMFAYRRTVIRRACKQKG